VVVRGHFFVHTLVAAGLVMAACGFRTRLYAERWCAWALLAATVVIPLGVTARLCDWYPHLAWMFVAGYLGVALLTLAIVSVMATARRVSPVTKRILELLDGAAVAAIVPMLLWVSGIYDMVRNTRF
jgi:type VII secretion integral membrane protein EccD